MGGLGLGFPLFCAFLFFIHVQLNFAEGNRNKYLTYRFSHSNAQINFGYRPKESRDALWAEIKAPAQSSRETAVEVPVAPKKEKTDTVRSPPSRQTHRTPLSAHAPAHAQPEEVKLQGRLYTGAPGFAIGRRHVVAPPGVYAF